MSQISREIYSQHGIRGIYKGLGITAINCGLGTGFYFYTYKALKDKFFSNQ